MSIILTNRDNYISKARDIVNTIIEYDFIDGEMGLLTGKIGCAVFLYYYNYFESNPKAINKANILIESCIKDINDGYKHHTITNGIAGVAWSIQHLKQNRFVKLETNEILEYLDLYIYNLMLNEISSNNFDFLHGALGLGIYFLDTLNQENQTKKCIDELIIGLNNSYHKDVDGSIKWFTNNPLSNISGYNLSLSHGLASIIFFLSKSYQNNIQIETTSLLLNKSIPYLLKNQLDLSQNKSYFPNIIIDDKPDRESRLSWCYGDLGIGVALHYAGVSLNNIDWQQKAIEILLYNTRRRNKINEQVIDACFCHGTSGIAHIYNRMYKNTKIIEFKETAVFWLDETIKMAKFNDGLANYKTWYPEKYGGWQNQIGILEGIAGIGLVLVSAITDIDPKWDSCLLLS